MVIKLNSRWLLLSNYVNFNEVFPTMTSLHDHTEVAELYINVSIILIGPINGVTLRK